MRALLLPVLWFLAACALFAPGAYAGSAKGQERHATLRLVAQEATVKPGQIFSVAIDQTLTKGWHTYWRNPGDSGTPMIVRWTLPPGFSASTLHWPVPHPVPYGPLMNYGYEDRATLIQDIQAPDPLPPGPVKLTADIEILVCMEICIPEQGTYTLTLNTPATPVDTALFTRARAAIPRTIPASATWREESGTFVLTAKLEDEDALKALQTADVRLFPEDWGLIENAADQTIALRAGILQVTQKRASRPASELPATSRMLVALTSPDGPAKGYVFEAVNTATGSGSATAPSGGAGFARALWAAILGGLILNLMPCVFPVLSIKALGSVRLAAHHPWKARLHGLAYTGGVVAGFLAIAGTLLLLRAGGSEIGWGFQLQNPLVVLGLAFLLFLIGLNLLGVFEVSLPLPARLHRHFSGEESAGSAALTGLLATAVATPCTAPFMGAALGYAMVQPAIVALSVFAALGVGLALPYLALSWFPALQSALPKPGAWMEIFRQALAFPMFASAAWLVWVLAQQAGPDGVLGALAGAVGVSFALWALQIPARKPRRVWILRVAAAAGFVAAIESALWVARQPPPAQIPNAAATFGERFSPEVLSAALSAPDNAPVFVEMTAAWCITCKVNHALALNTSSTRELIERLRVRYLVGDWTNADPQITKYLSSFGRNGVPLYVYYGPANRPGAKRPDPVVLPQVLTPGLVASTLDP
jgi:thiol:disulfide interchange protein/DsbC/DsbD-like thiol-disulfide interchange protein